MSKTSELQSGPADQVMTIKIGSAFSRFPGPRYRRQGPNSGEQLRETILVPALRGSRKIFVDLDGTAGFGSSFLDEAFGGLVRQNLIKKDEFFKVFSFKSEEDSAILDDIRDSVERS